jgi:hypothetical protein
MPQNLQKVSAAYAKSYYGVVIGSTNPLEGEPPTLMPSARVKTQLQELTENPDQVVIEPSPDPNIMVDLDPIPDPNEPTVEQDPLLGQVEIIRTGGNIPPVFPEIQPENQGNVVG